LFEMMFERLNGRCWNDSVTYSAARSRSFRRQPGRLSCR